MRHFVIGTSGHIDHGKSTLVKALTGTDPDRLKEEKARGITIDLGFAHYVDEDVDFAFVDVPGHERFVKNMLAGVGGFDCVMLVVAADESVMPQTREHFDICRLLHVRTGVVVLSKADLVDEETIELVQLEVQELVNGSFLERAPILPVSARTGVGLADLRRVLRQLADAADRRETLGSFRLPIDRVFSVKGFGTVVTGTVVAGEVGTEAEVDVLPRGTRVKVRGMQVHGAATDRARAGQRAAVNIGGVPVRDLMRGDTLAAPGSIGASRRLDARLETLPNARPLRHGTRVRLHQGTSEILARIAISRVMNRDGTAAPVTEIPPGAVAHVRIRLESEAVVTRGDRFVVRAYSPPLTIGGGVVLDPEPPRGATRSPVQHRRFDHLDPGLAGSGFESEPAIDRAVALLVEEAGGQGLPFGALGRRLGIPPERQQAAIARAVRAGASVAVGQTLVPFSVVQRLASTLQTELASFHRREPLNEGMPREAARERFFARGAPAVFEFVVATLVGEGKLVAASRLALSTHKVAVSDADAPVLARLEDVYRSGGLQPPDRAAVESSVGAASATVDRLVQLLLRRKALVRLDTLCFHAEALERLKGDVRALKATSDEIDVATFKDRFGVTRKYAIPLLEYLDRERVTRRVGDRRTVL
ncbi:MAG: selenocysteine-specific translation elongation factor [Vicinamibacterales bacterium]